MKKQPLRFCMITTFYPPYNFGGDGIFVQKLSNELALRGHQVDVIHCIDSYRLLTRHTPEKRSFDHPNVTVHGLKSPFGFLSPLATQQTGFPVFKSTRIRQILKKGFDVIHYHNISLIGGPKILTYGHGIKLYTMHEYWLICPSHVMFRFNREPCINPNCIPCILAHKRPPQLWRYLGLLNSAVKHVDAFIAPSYFCKKKHQQMGLGAPIVHLPNFSVTAESSSALSGQSIGEIPQKPYFLFVGRLEKLKGLHTLIPVFHHYHRAQLLIAGTGNYEFQLRKLAGGSNNIRFLGHQPQHRLHTLYRQATAVIIPSLCLEIGPMVILEAFREQTPVITRNFGSMPEFIRESGGGFIYNSDKELLAAMDQLITDPSYRHALGRRGYDTYNRKWTVEVHLKDYLKLIQDIAANSDSV